MRTRSRKGGMAWQGVTILVVAMGVVVMVVGYFWPAAGIALFAVWFIVLLSVLLVEVIVSRGVRFDSKKARRSTEKVGSIAVCGGALICSDEWKVKRREVIEGLPVGEYVVEVDTISSGGQKVVRLLRMTLGEAPAKSRATSRCPVAVDTGQLIIMCEACVPNEWKSVEKAGRELLDKPVGETVPVRLLRDDAGTAFGVIFEPGLGDDIYDVVVRRDAQGNCEVKVDCM
jgi:hypothetical protein